MSLKRSARLLAGVATSAALAVGGLAVTAPSAEAASPQATAMYNCTTPLPGPLGSFKVPATFSLETLDDALLANVPVPAGTPIVGQIDFTATGLVPSVILALQGAVNLVLGNIPTVGPQLAGPLNGVFTQLSGGVATVTAQLPPFTPGAGTLPVPVPTEFSFAPVAGALAGLGVTCKVDPSTITQPPGGGIPVITQKYGAKVKAKAVNKAGHKAVVTVKVKTSAGQKAVGSVKAKLKGMKAKTKALKNGKVTFSFKNLTLGKHKIKLRFLGNGYTNPAKKKVSVRVVR